MITRARASRCSGEINPIAKLIPEALAMRLTKSEIAELTGFASGAFVGRSPEASRLASETRTAVCSFPADYPQGVGERLVVTEYDSDWPAMFARLRDRAHRVLGDVAVAIEHVGSTAVPGLAGKTVIDIDVVVRSDADVQVALERLATIGYEAGGRTLAVPGLVAPRWPIDEPRHHLYVVVEGSDRHRERIAFRDYLRSHSEEARRYGDLKCSLALDFADDWEGYAEAKRAAVEAILVAAQGSRARDGGDRRADP